MALFKQDRDGRVRGRADAAGSTGDENGFLGHDFLPLLTSKMNNEHERCLRSTRFDYSDDDRLFPSDGNSEITVVNIASNRKSRIVGRFSKADFSLPQYICW